MIRVENVELKDSLDLAFNVNLRMKEVIKTQP